jgi:hypothetical protein
MASIFISHSRRDAETVAAFCNIFARTQLRAVFLEFENYLIPPWTQIKNEVQQASAVFLLLSPELNSSNFTQNWVSYEVGLACMSNKPVWVYEQWQNPVKFPVPYLTDYIVFDRNNRAHREAIKQHVEKYDPNPVLAGLALGGLVGAAFGGVGAGIGALLGAAVAQPKTLGVPTACPYPNCGIHFRVHSNVPQLLCPACRQGFHLNWPVQADAVAAYAHPASPPRLFVPYKFPKTGPF